MFMGTNFKGDRPSGRVQRALRTRELRADEDAAKGLVRRRDKSCRFPLCGCRKLRLSLEVSHRKHKGAGGNPAGDRSLEELMMLLCAERHKANPFSIDRGTVSWEPLTPRLGAKGPVRWLVDVQLLRYYTQGGARPVRAVLVEVARETSPGVAVVHPRYEHVFTTLASMQW